MKKQYISIVAERKYFAKPINPWWVKKPKMHRPKHQKPVFEVPEEIKRLDEAFKATIE